MSPSCQLIRLSFVYFLIFQGCLLGCSKSGLDKTQVDAKKDAIHNKTAKSRSSPSGIARLAVDDDPEPKQHLPNRTITQVPKVFKDIESMKKCAFESRFGGRVREYKLGNRKLLVMHRAFASGLNLNDMNIYIESEGRFLLLLSTPLSIKSYNIEETDNAILLQEHNDGLKTVFVLHKNAFLEENSSRTKTMFVPPRKSIREDGQGKEGRNGDRISSQEKGDQKRS